MLTPNPSQIPCSLGKNVTEKNNVDWQLNTKCIVCPERNLFFYVILVVLLETEMVNMECKLL